MASENTLWMGDIEPWMNDYFIKKSFAEYGFCPKTIKLIKDKKNNIIQNYCFIIFNNNNDANNALIKLNGKQIPNTKLNFKLNWTTKNCENCKNVYVGNLPQMINDNDLYIFFKSKYPSVMQASIVKENGISKKYGFVHFLNEEEYQRCLKEMDGANFNNNKIKVKERKKKNNENEQIKKNINVNTNKKNKNNNFLYNKINNNNYYHNNLNIHYINLYYIKYFYHKKIKEENNNKLENDDTTISSQDKEQDLSSSNSNIYKKRKFSDNIEILESDDNKILYEKAQESVNKTYEYYKLNNRFYEISDIILYYTSNNNQINNN